MLTKNYHEHNANTRDNPDKKIRNCGAYNSDTSSPIDSTKTVVNILTDKYIPLKNLADVCNWYKKRKRNSCFADLQLTTISSWSR